MRTNVKERIISSLITGVIIFMALCVAYKLFTGKEDWLSYSIIWSSAWTIGLFISKTIVDTFLDESIWMIIKIDLAIILVVFILVAFVLGVVCDMANCKKNIADITISFALSMLTNIRRKA